MLLPYILSNVTPIQLRLYTPFTTLMSKYDAKYRYYAVMAKRMRPMLRDPNLVSSYDDRSQGLALLPVSSNHSQDVHHVPLATNDYFIILLITSSFDVSVVILIAFYH